jgi:hypothetical protein
MGAFTVSQFGTVAPSEQSMEPPTEAGDTHEGLGGGGRQRPRDASMYEVPSGHTPASEGASATHPKGG